VPERWGYPSHPRYLLGSESGVYVAWREGAQVTASFKKALRSSVARSGFVHPLEAEPSYRCGASVRSDWRKQLAESKLAASEFNTYPGVQAAIDGVRRDVGRQSSPRRPASARVWQPRPQSAPSRPSSATRSWCRTATLKRSSPTSPFSSRVTLGPPPQQRAPSPRAVYGLRALPAAPYAPLVPSTVYSMELEQHPTVISYDYRGTATRGSCASDQHRASVAYARGGGYNMML